MDRHPYTADILCLEISTDKRLQWTKDPRLLILGKREVWKTSTFLTAIVELVATAHQLLHTAGEMQLFIQSRLLESYVLFRAGWSKSKSNWWYCLLCGAVSEKIGCRERVSKLSFSQEKEDVNSFGQNLPEASVMEANRNIQAVAFTFFFSRSKLSVRLCSNTKVLKQFLCPVPQGQQVPGRAQASILILRWVLQPQMCSVLPYCQQYLFSKFRGSLSIVLCSTKHIHGRPARFVLSLTLSPAQIFVYLWVFLQDDLWEVSVPYGLTQGQWQEPPTASYKDTWWSWASDLRHKDSFLEGEGKTTAWKAGKRWGTYVMQGKSIAVIWRERFRLFVPFSWDTITTHLKGRPPHLAVFQEVRRANTRAAEEGSQRSAHKAVNRSDSFLQLSMSSAVEGISDTSSRHGSLLQC